MKKKILPIDFLKEAIHSADTARRSKTYATKNRIAYAEAELHALEVFLKFLSRSNLEDVQFARNFLSSIMRDADQLRSYSVPEMKSNWITVEAKAISLLLELEGEKS